VAVFGRSEHGPDGVTLSDSGHNACVLAGGLAYILNLIDRRLLYTLTEYQLQTVVSAPGRELFIQPTTSGCTHTDPQDASGRVSVSLSTVFVWASPILQV
jgi:hypothetical protein